MRSLFPRFVEAERQRGSVLRAFRRSAVQQRRRSRSDRCRPGWGNWSARSSDICPPRLFTASTPVETSSGTLTGWRVTAPRRLRRRRAQSFSPVRRSMRGRAASAASIPEASDLCGDVSVRLDRERRAGLAAGRVAHPLHGIGFVVARAPDSAPRSPRARGCRRSGRPRACRAWLLLARVRRRRRTIPPRSICPDDELVGIAVSGSSRRSGHHGRRHPRACLSLARRRRAAQRRPPCARERRSSSGWHRHRALRRGQRLPRDRDPRLRRRRTRRGCRWRAAFVSEWPMRGWRCRGSRSRSQRLDELTARDGQFAVAAVE